MEKNMHIYTRKINFLGIFVVILFLFFIIFSINFLGVFEKNEVEAVVSEDTSNELELQINQNPIDISTILSENVEEDATWEMISEEIDLEYNTIYTENSDLPSGTIYVTQVRNRWNSRSYYNKKIYE